MKHLLFLLFFLFIPSLIWAQNISIDPRDISIANIELKRAVMENRTIKGTPYLDENFSKTRLEFRNGKLFEGKMRYHIGKDLFELKSIIDDAIYELRLTDGMKATHLGKNFEAHYLTTENKVVTFEVIVSPNPYGLYLYHKKVVEETHKEGISLPSSNQGNNQDAAWTDKSYMILINGTEVLQLTKSHKKILQSGMVDEDLYKKITKEKKYKLTKLEDVKELVETLNNNQ